MSRRPKGEGGELEPPREKLADFFVVKISRGSSVDKIREVIEDKSSLVFTVTPDFDVIIGYHSHDDILARDASACDPNRLVEGHIKIMPSGPPQITYYKFTPKMRGSFLTMYGLDPVIGRQLDEREEEYEQKFKNIVDAKIVQFIEQMHAQKS